MIWLRMARALYQRLPLSQRNRLRLIDAVYGVGGVLFRGTTHYQAWRRRQAASESAPLRFPAPDEILLADRLAQLRFSVPEGAPVVTVIVPCFGNLSMTVNCLLAVQRTGCRRSFEVLVAEDASGDTAIDALAEIPGLHYFRNPENLGFLRNCNSAAGRANGRFLVFLNNDTLVQSGWLDALLERLYRLPNAGLVRPRSSSRTGACKNPAESSGVMAAHGTMADSMTRPQVATTFFAKPTFVLAQRSQFPGSCSAALEALPSTTYRHITKTRIWHFVFVRTGCASLFSLQPRFSQTKARRTAATSFTALRLRKSAMLLSFSAIGAPPSNASTTPLRVLRCLPPSACTGQA